MYLANGTIVKTGELFITLGSLKALLELNAMCAATSGCDFMIGYTSVAWLGDIGLTSPRQSWYSMLVQNSYSSHFRYITAHEAGHLYGFEHDTNQGGSASPEVSAPTKYIMITIQGTMSKTRLNGALNGGGEELRARGVDPVGATTGGRRLGDRERLGADLHQPGAAGGARAGVVEVDVARDVEARHRVIVEVLAVETGLYGQQPGVGEDRAQLRLVDRAPLVELAVRLRCGVPVGVDVGNPGRVALQRLLGRARDVVCRGALCQP